MFDKKTIAPLVVIVISLVLLVINLMGLKNGNTAIWGIVSNILLIIAMVIVIFENKKKSKK
ncbi:hypothetical protein [Flagellimonas oceanensis]|uniref:hypothetical protein n=1 Tax=Flagellimonas oceanensis TaxID=2499163 RepID=UPI000F8CD6AC|nr:hypothetical protein [Allomuricauda oceanensis]|tara:strand:+ start:256 stop:438 length:183 start_codon:yes stop_codon:yes gene_type:complete